MFPPDIAMVNSADAGQGGHFCGGAWARLDRSWYGRVLAKRQMAAVFRVVDLVVTKKAPQMILICHNDMVKQLPPDGADETLSNSVLPGRAIRSALRFDAHVCHSGFDASAELPVAIEDQIARRGVEGKSLAQLTYDPLSGRMRGDTQMQQLSSVVMNNKEHIEHAKACRWYCEEVHGSQDLAMVAKEGLPLRGRTGIRRFLWQIPQYGSLADVETKPTELCMDAGRPPAVLGRHPLNERPNLTVGSWSTTFSRLPPPEGLEAFPVPLRDRLGFHDDEGALPIAPEAAQL